MEVQLKKWMGQGDAGYMNTIHGGEILRLIDEAAGLAAIRQGKGRVVTAAFDGVDFSAPVFVGQIVILSAAVNQVWRSSMEVEVRVVSEDVVSGSQRDVASAFVTMVAVDDHGAPRLIDPLVLGNDEARARAEAADKRRQMRLKTRDIT